MVSGAVPVPAVAVGKWFSAVVTFVVVVQEVSLSV